MVVAIENAAGPLPLENSNSTASEDTSYQLVEGADVRNPTANPTAGPITMKIISHQMTAGEAEDCPETPSHFLNEMARLRQQMGQLRAENISMDIKANQLERDNEELRVELSRVKMDLAKAKANSAKRKKKYDELLEDVSEGSDKLSKKLVKYKRRGDELESQLKEELAAQKEFWQQINQQLHKENESSLKEISELNERLTSEKALRAQEKTESKTAISSLEDKLEDALQEAAEMQINAERVKVENAKLRKEKTAMSADYEGRISKMGCRSPAPENDEEFSTEAMMRMMQETLGVDVDDFQN